MDEWNHLSELVLFALAMQETLKEINRLTSQNFELRVGTCLTCDTHQRSFITVIKQFCQNVKRLVPTYCLVQASPMGRL